MAKFKYVAIDRLGCEKCGVIDADSELTALGQLAPQFSSIKSIEKDEPPMASARQSLRKGISRIIGIVVCCAIIGTFLDVVLHYIYWIDFASFAILIGAFLAFAAVALIPSMFLTMIWDERIDDKIDDLQFCLGIGVPYLCALLSVPMGYYHLTMQGHSGFWSWMMLTTCLGVPILFHLSMGIWVSIMKKAIKIECSTAIEKEFETLRNVWRPYIMCEEKQREFYRAISNVRRKINIVSAENCRIRLIHVQQIKLHVVDKYLEQMEEYCNGIKNGSFVFEREIFENQDEVGFEFGWRFRNDAPESSFAQIQTEIMYNGDKMYLSIKLSYDGKAKIVVHSENGETRHLKREYSSWDEMLKGISKL